MEFSTNAFADIFDVVETAMATHPDIKSLDPIADLLAKSTVRIPYTAKPKNNAGSAFMVFKKKHKNWIGLLLEELKHFVTGPQADISIMHSSASAKSSLKKKSQTWFEFVTELHHDKIIHRMDISESQARQLMKLVDELSANGHKLKGCGSIEFYDNATGNVL